MRVQPSLGQAQIQTTYRVGATDRFVALNVYVPLPVPWPSTVSVAQDREFWDWVRCSSAQLAGDPLPPPPSGLSRRAPRFVLPRVLGWGTGLRSAPGGARSAVRGVVKAGSPGEALQHLRTAHGALAQELARGRMRTQPRARRGQAAVDLQARLTREKMRLDLGLLELLERALEERLDPPTRLQSEFGVLFLDRTRVRLAGLEVGEHFDSVALASGQEALYEIRSSLRRSVTVEDAIEREFENTLEQTAQLTSGRTDTEGTQESTQRTGATGVSLDVGASDPTGSVPVEASSSVSQNTSVATANNLSTQVSTNVALTTTSKVASRIRGNHRSVVKRETTETFDTLMRNTLRNANPGHGVTLHYYKILQRLECQQERTGARVCWAPLVADPGANLRLRATRAYQAVIDVALGSVQLPRTPTPPRKEFVPTWTPSSTFEVPLGMGIGTLLTFPSSGSMRFLVHVSDTEVFTGNVRATLGGEGAQFVEVTSVQVVSGPSDSCALEVEVAAEVGFVVGSPVVEVTIEVEVMREVPGYEEELAEYHRILRDREQEVSRLNTLARREAEPDAQAAMRAVLASTDVRDELLGAVFSQLIHGALGVPTEEVEFWHRVVDFEQLGYVAYPGWYRLQKIPLPELGARHFANLPLARVFLPIRPGYERVALAALIARDGLDTAGKRAVDQLIEKLEGEVTSLNASLVDGQGQPAPQALGAPRVESIPTAGAHVEMEVSVSSALDPQAAAQLQETVDRLHEYVLAAREENRLRANTQQADYTDVQVGPSQG